MSELKYQETWIRRPNLRGWRVDAMQGLAIGRCARCRHNTDVNVSAEITEVRVAAGTPVAERTRHATCDCDQSHEGAPAGTKGCGAQWLVGLAKNQDGQWTVVQGNADVRDAAAALDAALAAESTNVATAAEKWLPGVAAVYGLFGLAGLATASDDVLALSDDAKVATAAFAVLGLGATVAAIWWGYRAAYGWPTTSDLSNDDKLIKWHADRRDALKRRGKDLGRSVVGALIALALLTLAAGFVLFGEQASPPKPTVSVVYADGTVCGTLQEPTDVDGEAVLVIRHKTTAGTEDQVIALADVASITPKACS